jgi:hypothetical protein
VRYMFNPSRMRWQLNYGRDGGWSLSDDSNRVPYGVMRITRGSTCLKPYLGGSARSAFFPKNKKSWPSQTSIPATSRGTHPAFGKFRLVVIVLNPS